MGGKIPRGYSLRRHWHLCWAFSPGMLWRSKKGTPLRGSGRGKRKQRTLWYISRVFSITEFCSSWKGLCQSTVLNNNSARIREFLWTPAPYSLPVGPKVGGGGLQATGDLIRKLYSISTLCTLSPHQQGFRIVTVDYSWKGRDTQILSEKQYIAKSQSQGEGQN